MARLKFLLGPVITDSARVCVAFWLFGLINAVFYSIFLTAALDLVGPSIPKATVLLADVGPCLLAKLVALPLNFHHIPYAIRVVAFAGLSLGGILIITTVADTAPGTAIAAKLAGVALASISSGLGDLSFLGLTHHYGQRSVVAWSSGTGAAGLIGSSAFTAAVTGFGLSVGTALLLSAVLPSVMLVSFFVILPSPEGRSSSTVDHGSEPGVHAAANLHSVDDEGVEAQEDDALLGVSASPDPNPRLAKALKSLGRKWEGCRAIFLPYMLPLCLVYIAEYTINQGVAPTLLFPLPSTPFKHFRDFYSTYITIYQSGAFLARSSTSLVRIRTPYLPLLAALQIANLALLFLHALTDFIPSVYAVFGVVLWEGILGGLAYANTFAEIIDHVPAEDRELSLGLTSASDSAGVCVAGFLGLGVETFLCGWQVRRGRDFCRRL